MYQKNIIAIYNNTNFILDNLDLNLYTYPLIFEYTIGNIKALKIILNNQAIRLHQSNKVDILIKINTPHKKYNTPFPIFNNISFIIYINYNM
jgi:hypothetical protein